MNKFTYIAIIGIVFWVAETAYFGWNAEPINAYEAMADTIATIFIIWGIIGDWMKGVTWQKSTHISVRQDEVKDVISSL